MKTIIISLLISVASLTLSAQTIAFRWLHTIDNSMFGMHSCTDNQNNLIVVGHFKGKIKIEDKSIESPDTYSVVLMKFSKDGELLWITKDDVTDVSAVTVDKANNIIISGTNSVINPITSFDAIEISFIYIDKFSSSGSKIWSVKSSISETRPPDGSMSTCLTVDNSENIFIAGRIRSDFSIGGFEFKDGQNSIFIIKTDSSGNLLLGKTIEPTKPGLYNASIPNDLIIHDDDLYLTGSYYGQTQIFPYAHSNGLSDIYLIRMSKEGDIRKFLSFGGKEADEGIRLYAVDGQVHMLARFGDVIKIGDKEYEAYQSYHNSLLISFINDSVNGSTFLGKTYGGLILQDICADKDNNILYTGALFNNEDYFPAALIKVNASGEGHLIGKIIQSKKDIVATTNSVSSNQSGDIYVTGAFEGPVVLNGEYYNDSISFIGQLDTSVMINIANHTPSGQISVYPSITSGKVIIDSKNKNLADCNARLYNSTGTLCSSYQIESFPYQIDISWLAAGLYLIQISSEELNETHKVFKK